jgi:hypothetical protein
MRFSSGVTGVAMPSYSALAGFCKEVIAAGVDAEPLSVHRRDSGGI